MPGPHCFAVRGCVVRLACLVIAHGGHSALRSRRTPDAARVHRISSRVRDDRDTPLQWDKTASDIAAIWGFGKPEYFFLWDWTGQITPNLARRARVFLRGRRCGRRI